MNKTRAGGNNEYQQQQHDLSSTNDGLNRSSYSSSGSGGGSTTDNGNEEECEGMEIKRSVKSIVQGITRKLSSHQLKRPPSWTKNNVEVVDW